MTTDGRHTHTKTFYTSAAVKSLQFYALTSTSDDLLLSGLIEFLNPRLMKRFQTPTRWPQKCMIASLKKAELSSWTADMNWGNWDDVWSRTVRFVWKTAVYLNYSLQNLLPKPEWQHSFPAVSTHRWAAMEESLRSSIAASKSRRKCEKWNSKILLN